MRAFVVAGSPAARRPAGSAPQAGDLVVAADLGAQHARAWGWRIDLLVGDLDSLPVGLADRLRGEGLETVRVPAAKDQTDTELALTAALARSPEQVFICGALGGRSDHLLANVLLLAHPSLAGMDVCLVDGPETIRLVTADGAASTVTVWGENGDLVSLLPFGSDAEAVETSGLLYPLRSETLYLGAARGVSNVMQGERADVSLTHGRLLVIQNRIETL